MQLSYQQKAHDDDVKSKLYWKEKVAGQREEPDEIVEEATEGQQSAKATVWFRWLFKQPFGRHDKRWWHSNSSI